MLFRSLSEKERKFAELLIIHNKPAHEALLLAGYTPGNKQSASSMASTCKRRCKKYINFLIDEKVASKDYLNIGDVIENAFLYLNADIKDIIKKDAYGRDVLTDSKYTKAIDSYKSNDDKGEIDVKLVPKLGALKQLTEVYQNVQENKNENEKRKLDLIERGLAIKEAMLKGDLQKDSADVNLFGALDSLAKANEAFAHDIINSKDPKKESGDK